jgi:hypothetical protein
MDNNLFSEYKNYYQQMHRMGHFAGGSLKKEYIPKIASMVEETSSKTLLDYGCGKADHYRLYKINRHFGIADQNTYFYDIGVPEYEILPEGKFDLVICTDVLEHVPEDNVADTLAEIFEKAVKAVFMVIYCAPAKKNLPNGMNAHVTVKPPSWWKEQIKMHHKKQRLSVRFNA